MDIAAKLLEDYASEDIEKHEKTRARILELIRLGLSYEKEFE